jgi:hypothetical protein
MPSPVTHRTEEQQIEQVLADQDKPFEAESEEPMEADPGSDGTSARDRFAFTTFSRMRKSWIGDDLTALMEIDDLTRTIIDNEFAGPIALIARIRKAVRIPVIRNDGSGEVEYSAGEPVWQRDEDGFPVEDWTALSNTDREAFLFTITTHLMEWKRSQAALWRRAMFAKAQWEETFAKAFHALPGVAISGKPTIPDRTQVGHSFSIEQRYFAVLQSSISKEADAIIKSMEVLQSMLLRTLTS